jgi:ribosomal protein L32
MIINKLSNLDVPKAKKSQSKKKQKQKQTAEEDLKARNEAE